MVIIEPEPEITTTAQEKKFKNVTKSSSTSTSKKKVVDEDAATTTETTEATDGFETASEGEFDDDNDDDDDDDSNVHSHQQNHLNQPEQQQQQQQQQHEHDEEEEGEDQLQINPTKDDSTYEDAFNDDQLKQRALAQANDAKLEGNKLFGNGLYEEALLQYELALQVAPEMPSANDTRSTCYANRAICFLKLEKYEDTVKECTKALELNPDYLKALIRRGEAHEKLQHFDEAIADMGAILKLDPGNVQSQRTIARLKPMAEEKREKMKEEMIGKLKEMGNSVLGRFGMSVDNFKAIKDPNTGSYSISFQR